MFDLIWVFIIFRVDYPERKGAKLKYFSVLAFSPDLQDH